MSQRLTLLTRATCPSCDEARAVLARIAEDRGVEWREIDVDGDAELRAEYGDRVPVVLVNEVEHCYWHIDEDRLRQVLRVRG